MFPSRRQFLAAVAAVPFGAYAAVPLAPDGDWPEFRGRGGRGVTDGFPILSSWNADSAAGAVKGVLWRVRVPGLGHSSPIIWGERIFLPSSVASAGAAPLKLGRTGESTPANDNEEQHWVVLCYDKKTGKKLW